MPSSEPLVQVTRRDGVATLRLNDPRRLNGWTLAMMGALREATAAAADDDAVRVVVLTGTDPYYCAGVDLAGSLRLRHPRRLRDAIVAQNRALFDLFIDFPKPLLAAVNGPAIGASVTSAALCDAILASEKATFSTPFAALGVPAEGCSSVTFPRLLGERSAARILGAEGWKPTGAEAAEIGLAEAVVPHERLLDEAHALALRWIAAGGHRRLRGGATREELRAVNAVESERVADAFLAAPFLDAQYRFLKSRGKRAPAAMFLGLRVTRPLWSRLL